MHEVCTYLLHFSQRDRLGLETGVGPALPGVPSGSFSSFTCGLSEAVEESHLLRQAKAGQIRLVWDRKLVFSGCGRWSRWSRWSRLLGFLHVRLLHLDSCTGMGGVLEAERWRQESSDDRV